MVVVDKLTKVTHFTPAKSTYKAINITEIFMKEIFRHGIPKTMITNKDTKFTSIFWKSLFSGLDTKLNFTSAYHPLIDGKIEWVNGVLKDMLHMYVMKQPGEWEYFLHLVEFSYNNGYRDSLKMSCIEELYGKK